jgi:colanic acid biosynthesis glycosyl transferase WcaI
MKILLYATNYYPELTGSGKYSAEMARWLSERGHAIRVVTAPPYYPEWKIRNGYRGWKYQVERGAIRVYRCPIWVPSSLTGRKRILHLLSFAISSLPIMLRQVFWRPDAVLVVEPPIVCAPAAWIVARICGARCWLHIQDFEVDAAFDLGLVKGERVRRVVAAGERWLMRRFDRVSTISENMLNRLAAKGVTDGVLFRNWVDTQTIFPLTVPSSFRAELGIANDAIVSLYSGNMGRKQGLEILADAARTLAKKSVAPGTPSSDGKPDVVFVFCGAGAGRADLEEACAGLRNVRFLDLQPVGRLNELLNMADIHLLPQKADAADLLMPSKLTGMMASGRPTLATAHEGTEIAKVLANAGSVVEPGDVKAFCEKLTKLSSDRQLRERLGRAARKFAEQHLSRDSILSSFEWELETCATGK